MAIGQENMKILARVALVPVLSSLSISCGKWRAAVSTQPDQAVAADEPQNLGFLGAAGCGAASSLSLPDRDHPDQVRHPGGVVIQTLEAGSPLERIGVRAGDVVVRVADDDLPNKENPALDLLARIELALSAGKTEIALEYLRAGKLARAVLPLDREELPPLNQGDLNRHARYALAAQKGLEFLARTQRADGGFAARSASRDAELAVTAMAGLAFLAGQPLPDSASWQPALGRCRDFVLATLDQGEIHPVAAAFAALFLAEWTMRTPGDQSVAPALAKAVERIVRGQAEDGSWSLGEAEPSLGYCERTLASQYGVQALGAAERAGIVVDNAVFERAFAALKRSTNDGRVGFVPEPGFDRRSEAGRLAGILVALRSAGCDFSDPFADKLFQYHSAHAKEIAFAPVDESLHLLSSALLARQKGLPQWIVFNYAQQVLLLSLQKRDGSFTSLPKSNRRALPFLDDCLGTPWRTAVFSLILLLQEDGVPILSPPVAATFAKQRDSDGKVTERSKTADTPAAATGAMQFESIDQAVEYLKKMGMSDDDPQLKQLLDMQKQQKKD